MDDAESTLAASSIATETPEFIRRPAERKPARAAGATEQRRILPYSPTRISSILDRQDYGLLQTLEALESELMSIGWSARYFITQQSGNDLSYALIYARPGGLPGSLTGFRSNYKENLKLAFEGLFSAK